MVRALRKPPNTHRIQNNTKHSENGEIHLFQGWKLTRARVSFIRFLCVWGAYFKAYSRGRHWNPTVFTCPPKHGERHTPRKAWGMRYPAPNKTHTRIKNPVFYTSFWPHPLEISYASFWLKLKISKSGNAMDAERSQSRLGRVPPLVFEAFIQYTFSF